MNDLYIIIGIFVFLIGIVIGAIFLLVPTEDPVIGLDDIREKELNNRNIGNLGLNIFDSCK